jgi:hypothetical protein
MTATEVTRGVLRAGAFSTGALAAGAWWVADAAAAAGVAGGGAVALLNFRWLSRDVARLAVLVSGGARGGAARLAGVGLRQLASFGALGLLVAGGWVHPVGVALGLAVLPPVLLAQGLRASGGSE